MLKTIRNSGILHLDRLRRAAISYLGGATVGVRAIVLREDRHVLLVRHTYMEGWYTPGGGVRHSESPVAALRRELFEETGLRAVDAPELLHVFARNYRGTSDYPIVYLVSSFEGEATIMDPFEIAQLQWVPLDRAVAIAASGTAAFLSEFINGGGYREWW